MYHVYLLNNERFERLGGIFSVMLLLLTSRISDGEEISTEIVRKKRKKKNTQTNYFYDKLTKTFHIAKFCWNCI